MEEVQNKKRPLFRMFLFIVGGLVLISYFVFLFLGYFGQNSETIRELKLPPPIVNPNSPEICFNSRVSYHGGWSNPGTYYLKFFGKKLKLQIENLTMAYFLNKVCKSFPKVIDKYFSTQDQQMLSNILYVMGKIPLESERTIYVANCDNVYIYNPKSHSLSIHLEGDHRNDVNTSFQIGYSGNSIFDAGVSLGIAQLESVALWNGIVDQLSSCPRTTDRDYANDNWNPSSIIHMVTSFGIRNVDGLTSTLVAKSSNGTLPDPITDSSVKLDEVIGSLKYGTNFKTTQLNINQISQLLWAGYGCSDHYLPYDNVAGLTVASAHYNYYLTRRIYVANSSGVYRYHNRLPDDADIHTRDHRIELISSNDVRSVLQSAVSELPVAPCYFILCLSSEQSSNYKAILEVGFVAVGMLVQSSAIGLQCHFKTFLTPGKQSKIQEITGIPSSDVPISIISVGFPGKLNNRARDAKKPLKIY